MSLARFQKYTLAVLVFTIGVILWGAFVRATGSGAGCGSHWPTCHGEVLPRPKDLAMLIEFTHRVTSGLSFLMVAFMLWWARKLFPSGHSVRRGSWFSMGFMVSEALLGAGLVLLKLVADDSSNARAFSISLHLINTYFLVAWLTLTAYWAYGGGRPRWKGQGLVGALLGVGLVMMIFVGVSGAITALGDTLFPATSLAHGIAQDQSPTAHLFVRLRIIHPIFATVTGGYLFLISGPVAARRPSPSSRRWASVLAGLILLQIAIGVTNLVLLAPAWMQIVHLFFADACWVALVLLAASALSREEAAPAGAISAEPAAI